MNHKSNNAMNQPSSSRFPTNDCYIYERYKTFLLNNVSFMALVSFQVNFIWASHRDLKNETEKQNIYNNILCILALNATKEAIRLGGGIEKINLVK